ncbi:MAG: glycosyltransferase family 2 protein [Lachnospiraceae bacterium]|nr:glycosyltransferase family 2 protein [Lachnospiraceae bacterium]
MADKKISIIIPCYNVESYVDRCFESLRNQTLGMDYMELIFVNDASTDNTLSKIMEYEKQYPDDIMVVNLEENRGLGAVRNIALQYASAPYVGCVDSDDFVDGEMFEKMIEVIDENHCDFVECDWGYFSEKQAELKKSAFEIGEEGYYDFSDYDVKMKYIAEQLFFTSACNKVYSREFLANNNLFFWEGKRYEDIFFCFLVILYAKSYCHIAKTYYHYYLNPKGIVQQRTAPYQFDRMDVSLAFLDACLDRGLYEQYKDAVEWMFLEKYYVYMIWDIWDVFTDQAYDYYLEMKTTIVELIPDYKSNPFRQLPFNKMDDMLLKLLEYPLSQEEFENLMEKLWKQQNMKA